MSREPAGKRSKTIREYSVAASRRLDVIDFSTAAGISGASFFFDFMSIENS